MWEGACPDGRVSVGVCSDWSIAIESKPPPTFVSRINKKAR